MRFFFLVLLITIFAIGDSLLKISLLNDEPFATDFVDASLYTYRMILGDFGTDKFGTVQIPLVYVFFVICTFLNMIVMLNLLIAIISDSFA